jgi:hypothetical protein
MYMVDTDIYLETHSTAQSYSLSDLHEDIGRVRAIRAMGDFLDPHYWGRPPELPNAKVGRIRWIQ